MISSKSHLLPFPLFLALKYLKPNRSFISAVTVISVLGVLLGVSILVIVLSVMNGFDNMWREKILSFKPHLTVVNSYGHIRDEDELCEKISHTEGVTGVAAGIETRVLIQNEGRILAPVVIGMTPSRAAGISRVPEFMVNGDFDLNGENIVIGNDLAHSLRLFTGDKALVYSPLNVLSADELYLPEELTVAGTFNLGMRDYDSGFVLTSLDIARELVGLEEGAYSIYIMTDDPFKFADYSAAVRKVVPPGYEVKSWREIDSVLFAALSNEKSMMFVLLVFISIVAIFCVTNTLIVITVHRTAEIGLLKAVGFSPRKIMAAFVWHGWIQCLMGTVLGIGAGLLVLHNLKNIVAGLSRLNIEVFPKEIYGLAEIPWSTSFSELANISIVVMTFCTIASFIPAYRAARLDPVEALRGE